MNKKLKVIHSLIKVQLKTERLVNHLMYTMIFFIFISYILINNLITETYKLEISINIWDGIFSIITQPSFILFIYLPVFLLATSVLISRNSFSKYLIVRCSKKSWIASRILCQLIINFTFSLCYFLFVTILSAVNFDISSKWSDTITDSQSISMLSTKLYPNNFVLVMTPYKALIFSFFGVFLSMCIITLLRDLFMEFVQNIIVANIMTITYIVANFVLFAFPLKNLVGTIFAYISLYNVSMIWCHKFSSVALSAIPLNMGLLSGFMFISAIIVFRLIFSRRMVIAND